MHAKDSMLDKADSAHEIKGAGKERLGRTTNGPNLEAEGSDEKTDGKVQNKIGGIEKVFNQ